ncbi:MAG: YfhO family protein, partial [Nanoarchaeota archaeon]
LIFRSFKSTMITFPEAIVILSEQEKYLVVGLRNLILPIALIFATSCFLLIVRINFFRNLAASLLFLFLVFDLFRFGHKYMTFTKESLVFPKTPVIDFLIRRLESEGPFRVEGGDVIPMNMLAPFGIETMEGYDAYYSLEYAKFLSKINSGDPTQPLGRYGEIKKYDSEFIDIGNVKYILALKRDKIAVPSPNGIPDYIFDLEKLSPVFEDGTVVVFENKNAKERAFFESGTGNIQFIEYQSNYKKLTVNAREDSNIVLSETYYPGWKAFVDGVETDIYLSKDVYKSVALSEGEHIVEFIYDPESFKIGKWVSFATLLTLIAILIYGQTAKERLSVTRKRSS